MQPYLPTALASPIRPSLDIDNMVNEADLVCRGRVIDVSYRDAETHPDGQRGAPHTFVTYEVDEVLKGEQQTSATLRFLGGPLDESKFVRGADSPLFDAGDDDLLLVKGNGQMLCPLVSCADGRLRVFEGKI